MNIRGKFIKGEIKAVRKSGKDFHDRRGGIDFYKIRKRKKKIFFSFTPIEDKFLFHIKA